MIALVAAFWLSEADARTVNAQVAPREAVVYADRARVVRRFSADFEAGRHEFVFEGLPASFIQGTATAELLGGSDAKLVGLDARRISAAEAADKRVKEIDLLVQAELDKLVDVQDRLAAAGASSAVLGESRGQAASALSHQVLYGSRIGPRTQGLLDVLSTSDAKVRDALRAGAAEKLAIEERVAALQREKSTLGSSLPDTFTVTVRVETTKSAKVQVDLAYLVSGAHWVPRYDIRGDAGSGKVEVSLSAMIGQTTGEDWKDVDLTVSSARPGLGTTVPVLDPFWLQAPQRYRPSKRKSADMGSPKAASAPSRAMKEEESLDEYEPEPMEVVEATVDLQLAATAFKVDRATDIVSDGTERKVLLTVQQLDSTLRHVVVPRVDPRAFVVGELKNTAPFPLLPGKAGVFLGGGYLGEMDLALVAPTQTFDVAFGVDDRVRVKRRPKKISEGQQALIGKRAKSTWIWEVVIKNTNPLPINVDLREQMPISTRQEIDVKRLPAEKGQAEPTDTGNALLRFTYLVKSGEENVLTWGYSVEYPSDLSLGWLE
jgi:uncharacterized protein (TIGR02231 family)